MCTSVHVRLCLRLCVSVCALTYLKWKCVCNILTSTLIKLNFKWWAFQMEHSKDKDTFVRISTQTHTYCLVCQPHLPPVNQAFILYVRVCVCVCGKGVATHTEVGLYKQLHTEPCRDGVNTTVTLQVGTLHGFPSLRLTFPLLLYLHLMGHRERREGRDSWDIRPVVRRANHGHLWGW